MALYRDNMAASSRLEATQQLIGAKVLTTMQAAADGHGF